MMNPPNELPTRTSGPIDTGRLEQRVKLARQVLELARLVGRRVAPAVTGAVVGADSTLICESRRERRTRHRGTPRSRRRPRRSRSSGTPRPRHCRYSFRPSPTSNAPSITGRASGSGMDRRARARGRRDAVGRRRAGALDRRPAVVARRMRLASSTRPRPGASQGRQGPRTTRDRMATPPPPYDPAARSIRSIVLAAVGHGPHSAVYPHRPMVASHRPDSVARERANELIRSWDSAPGPARQPARPGHARRPGRCRRSGSTRSSGARSRRPRSCGRSTSRSG